MSTCPSNYKYENIKINLKKKWSISSWSSFQHLRWKHQFSLKILKNEDGRPLTNEDDNIKIHFKPPKPICPYRPGRSSTNIDENTKIHFRPPIPSHPSRPGFSTKNQDESIKIHLRSSKTKLSTSSWVYYYKLDKKHYYSLSNSHLSNSHLHEKIQVRIYKRTKVIKKLC